MFVARATKPKSKPGPNILANLYLSCTLRRTVTPHTEVWGIIWNPGNRSAMLHASITINGRYQSDPWKQLLGVGIRGSNLIIPANRGVGIVKVFTPNAIVSVVIRNAVTNITYFSKQFNPTTCWRYIGPIPLYKPPPPSKKPIPTDIPVMM